LFKKFKNERLQTIKIETNNIKINRNINKFSILKYTMIEYLYLIGGLILLIQGSDWLLEGSASLAKKFNNSGFHSV